MEKEEIQYQILEECKCGPEEFFVLVSSVEEQELDLFLSTLVGLVEEGFLQCNRGKQTNIHLSAEDVLNYIQKRLNAGERLNEHPEVCKEYAFVATEKGIKFLREEDRPITL